jgi:hypothetical protein
METNATTSSPAGDESPQATLEFLPGWRDLQHGTIKPGGKLTIVYDPDRLPQCRMNWRGAEVWDIEVYIRFHPCGQFYRESVLEKIRTPPGMGMVTQLIPKPVEVGVPPDATQVELWFRNFYEVSSRCEAWDSRFGQNYWYPVVH